MEVGPSLTVFPLETRNGSKVLPTEYDPLDLGLNPPCLANVRISG